MKGLVYINIAAFGRDYAVRKTDDGRDTQDQDMSKDKPICDAIEKRGTIK
jgi:hypothetical protein